MQTPNWTLDHESLVSRYPMTHQSIAKADDETEYTVLGVSSYSQLTSAEVDALETSLNNVWSSDAGKGRRSDRTFRWGEGGLVELSAADA